MDINFVCDEIEYAKKIKSGEIDKCDFRTICKYLTKLEKQKSIENDCRVCIEDIIDICIDFIKKSNKDFDEIEKYNEIVSMVKKNLKSEIIKTNGIEITKHELETISKLNNKHLEILSFCMLAYKKVLNIKGDKDGKILKKPTKEFYSKLTKDTRSRDNQNLAIYKLVDKGLVGLPKVEDWGKTQELTLNYIDFDYNKDDIEILISDMREIRLHYLKWKYERYAKDKNYDGRKLDKVGECKECGKLIAITGKNHKHCVICRKKLDNKSTFNSVKRSRNAKC